MGTALQMNIVGISAYYHDSAAALIRDGEIVAAVQEGQLLRHYYQKYQNVHPNNG